jgi:hypothetical protein
VRANWSDIITRHFNFTHQRVFFLMEIGLCELLHLRHAAALASLRLSRDRPSMHHSLFVQSPARTQVLFLSRFSLRPSPYLSALCGCGEITVTAETAEKRRGPQRKPQKRRICVPANQNSDVSARSKNILTQRRKRKANITGLGRRNIVKNSLCQLTSDAPKSSPRTNVPLATYPVLAAVSNARTPPAKAETTALPLTLLSPTATRRV